MAEPNDPEPDEEIPGGPAAPTVCSRDLLRDGRELLILHGGERYRLLLTRSNKLILTR
jgi:hemin uptake protein HemP